MIRLPSAVLSALSILLLQAGCETSPKPRIDEAAEASDPYAALDRLADQLKASAEVAREAGASNVPFGRGEGALHVMRLLRRAIDEELVWADTDHPYFQAQDERYAKLALGNPDNLYLVTRVEDDALYRISGRRGTTADFNIQIYQGYPGIHRPMTAKGALGLARLELDEDDRFEVIVGGPRREKNWIELAPGSRRILVRYTYGDWATEEAGEIGIERVGTRGVAGRPVGDDVVASRIDAAAEYLEDSLTGYLELSDQVYAGLEMNTLRPLRTLSGAVGGLDNQYNASGRYRLSDDQALIITTRPSDARYQGIQIGTEWFESLDFANQVTSLNTQQAQLSSDGVYRFVISTRDPGFANWLDASGAPLGQVLLRWQGAEKLGVEHEPQVELVDFDSIASHFPVNDPKFDEASRREQISVRQNAIERRFGLARR
jgi:hypothetical protein